MPISPRNLAIGTLLVAQGVLAARIGLRMARTASGTAIPEDAPASAERVTALVPVLDELHRLEPCLAGLAAQGDELAEVIVIDGGSTDGTPDLVRRWIERDQRIRLVAASPPPAGANGKAHQLAAGEREADAGTGWVMTIDADVRPAPGLLSGMLEQARREGVEALSVATRQRLSNGWEALVHPAMLATLVYRFGIPGSATTDIRQVQANGQCALFSKGALAAVGGFGSVTDSTCEDVTIARSIAASGRPVGFYEGGSRVETEMYAGAADAWRNWSRSLPMADRYSRWSAPAGLAEVTLVQALPLAALGWLAIRGQAGSRVAKIQGALVLMRLGTLAGMARAYRSRPATYWLSPLADLPVAVRLWLSLAQRRQVWRGREVVRGGNAR